MLAVIGLCAVLTFTGFAVLRAVAAHYGSVSVGTYAVAAAYFAMIVFLNDVSVVRADKF